MLQRVHNELVVAHAAIGLRQGQRLVELIAVLVFHNNLHRETAATHADGFYRHLAILRHFHLTVTITVVLCIDTIDGTLGVHTLAHQFLPGNVYIAQVGQRRNTQFAVAVVVERTARNLVVVHLAIVLTVEVHAGVAVGTFGDPLVLHNLVTQGCTADLLASAGIAEGLYNEVVLLWHHHEFHAIIPVAQAIELEILADVVLSRLVFLLESG